MLEVSDKDFKAAIITLLKDVRKNMLIMNEKIRNLNRELETIKNKNSGTKIYSIWNKNIHWMGLSQNEYDKRKN